MTLSFIFFPVLIGYLMGSIPYGLLLAKLSGIKDLQNKGSGNIGATNVYRVGGKKLGVLTLVLDYLKGVLTVVLCQILDLNFYLGGAACVLGHMFPIWLKFKGGKGVATYMGTLIMWCWMPGLLATVIWFSSLFIFRISSIASLCSIIGSILFLILLPCHNTILFALPLAFIIVLKHQSNIKRLLKGQEL